MKKVFSLIITLVLIFALSVSAFAASSVSAPIESKDSTADAPVVKEGTVILVPVEDNQELTEEQQQTYEEALADVENVVPEGAKVNFINYVMPVDGSGSLDIELEGDFTEVFAKLFADGEWTDVEVEDKGDNIYSLFIPHEGVLAIMTK